MRNLAVAIGAAILVLALAGCGHRPCLRSHAEWRAQVMLIMTGKVLVPIWYHGYVNVCDVYADQP